MDFRASQAIKKNEKLSYTLNLSLKHRMGYIDSDSVDHYSVQDPNGWLKEISDGNVITNTIGMEFVPIVAGEFDMGSPLSALLEGSACEAATAEGATPMLPF